MRTQVIRLYKFIINRYS